MEISSSPEAETKIIKSKKDPKKTYAAPKEVLLWLDTLLKSIDTNTTVAKNETKAEIKELKFEKMRITRNGNITLLFNQKLRNLGFTKKNNSTCNETTNSTKGRGLLSLYDLDVEREVVTFTFISRSGGLPANFSYTLEITDWTTDGVDIFMNISDPLLISRIPELPDMIIANIKNLNFFISADNG